MKKRAPKEATNDGHLLSLAMGQAEIRKRLEAIEKGQDQLRHHLTDLELWVQDQLQQIRERVYKELGASV